MIRTLILATALLLTCAACSQSSDSTIDKSPSSASSSANQVTGPVEILAERIKGDVVGRVVTVTKDTDDEAPVEWTFDPDEVKQVEILDRELGPATVAVTVFITTHNYPNSDESAIQVTGKLRLLYQRQGAEWTLDSIENLTFHYKVGVST